MKALLVAAMQNTLDAEKIVPLPGTREVSYHITPAATSLLQQSPVSGPPTQKTDITRSGSGLEAVLDLLKSLSLEDYCEVFRKEKVSGTSCETHALFGHCVCLIIIY